MLGRVDRDEGLGKARDRQFRGSHPMPQHCRSGALRRSSPLASAPIESPSGGRSRYFSG